MMTSPRSIVRRLRNVSFRTNEKGSVAIIFAAAAITLSLIVAGSVEYHRRNLALQELQNAADAAALDGKRAQVRSVATAGLSGSQSKGSLTATQTFNAIIAKSKNFSNIPAPTTAWSSDGTLTVTATPGYKMLLLGDLLPSNFNNLKAVASANAGSGIPTEVSILLDSTTSMLNKDGRADTRFTLMRNAAKKFTHQLFDAAAASGDPNLVRISVVPWSTTVNVLGAAPAAADLSGSTTVSSIYDGGSLVSVASPMSRASSVTVDSSKFVPTEWRGCVSGSNDNSGYSDQAVTTALNALSVPPVPINPSVLQIGPLVTSSYQSCTCTQYGDDGKPCWDPGRQGFNKLIEKTVPQIRSAAFLFNKDMKDDGAPKTENACAGVCLQQSCVTVPSSKADCTVPTKLIPYTACHAWDMYGRQAAYVQYPNPTCIHPWYYCYDEASYQALPVGVTPCVADPNEPRIQNNTIRWCEWYNDGNRWTRDIRIGGPNMNCPAPMLGLSSNRRQVIEYIDRMFPTPGGTHADVGLRWGLRTLTPNGNWPNFFGLTKAPETYAPDGRKVMILITDGENEQAIDYPGYWGCRGIYAPNYYAAQPDCKGSPDKTELNNRMLNWCTAIRGTYGIDIYAISVNVAGSASQTILTQCTGDASRVFSVDAADLSSVLSVIGSKIMAMRLSQ